MKFLSKITSLTLLTASLAGLNANASTHDNSANTPAQHNLITFSVSSQTTVANDESRASLSTNAQARNAQELAEKLNPVINQALALAKKYPDVVASTGNRHSHPSYDKHGKITGVTGHASILLTSKNTDQLANLLSELQVLMSVDNLSFGVSDKLSEETQAQLMLDATQKFQAQAATITKAWGAKNHRLISATMGSDRHNTPYAVGAMAADAVMVKSANMNLETGDSEIRYTINGTIQLIY